MKWMIFTNTSGDKLALNMARAEVIRPADEGCWIFFASEAGIQVKETFDEIASRSEWSGSAALSSKER